MQSLPVVSISFDTTFPLSETNQDLGKLIFSLSEPAPVGGLAVNFNTIDQDGVPDDINASIINGTILFDENNVPSGILIDEGATEAGFEISPKQDNITEGEEISIVSLLPGNAYTIDPNSRSATFILTDLPIVTFNVDRNVISEGGEPQVYTFQLNEPAPDGGLTVRLLGEDSDRNPAEPIPVPELFNNINLSDVKVVEENGLTIFEFTILPGVTSATFGLEAPQDNEVEGDETFSLTLLDAENYSIDSAIVPIVTTITEKSVINGTSNGEQLFGTDASEFIIGFEGNDTIFGNGGKDNLIGNQGDDLIYGGSQADTILGGDGNDTIFANGGGDLINSGTGKDIVWLGAGFATVVLENGEGFDIVNNFQLGATTLQVGSTNNLSFADSANGLQIFQGDDLFAVISSQFANTFSANQNSIFVI
jgi:serralysin